MSTLKVTDPAMYKALREKKAKKVDAKKAALAALIAFANEKGDDKLRLAAKLLTKRASSEHTQKSTILEFLADMFKNRPAASPNTIHEDEVFKTFKLGRSDMRSYITNAIKKAKPEERLWISFNLGTGIYKLEGKGKDAPAGWTGYRPLVVDGAEVK